MIHPTGGVFLAYSHETYEFFVPLGFTPRRVFLSIRDEGLPVCGGSVSKTGTMIRDNGFVLYADVRSDFALIEWAIER